MMVGSSVFEGFVPDEDATVATRVLDAGAEILGKAVCENLCLDFGSHTAATGPVRNPHDPTRVTGGSSAGCAALVASKAVDLAIGGAQGGPVNTGQFDNSGHPAISVPCGTVDGLPVGLMLVGRFGEDATVLRAAHAFEQA